jgi:small subunit ribosomal protein S24e
MQDAAGPVTVRTSKFITNRLLNRKQFVVTVLHPTRANLSRDELSDKLAALYKTEKKRVVVFGLKTKFGGASSQGFGLIYDDEDSQMKFEPKYRLVRVCPICPSHDMVLILYSKEWPRRPSRLPGSSGRRGRTDLRRYALSCIYILKTY